LSFLFMFTIGGLTGLFLAALSVDVHLHDTYFVVAHFHYVMMGGTVMGLLAGLHYWWPKMFGKMVHEWSAKISWGLIFIGFNMTFFTQFFLGYLGMPRRYYDYPPEYAGLNMISTIGSWFLLAGFALMAFYFIRSLFLAGKSPAKPWGGKTHEWQIASPPTEHNFPEIPTVTGKPYDYGVVKL
ncbi:MAG: cbb3-type cytochrome c oxidase subunit I, partial [bacterium]|nr:cbb3-type cytochrome c oxidase subunit I [bacterium]